MAYLKALERRCQAPGCSSRATVELYNRVNTPLRVYCRRHGQQALRDLQRREGHAHAD